VLSRTLKFAAPFALAALLVSVWRRRVSAAQMAEHRGSVSEDANNSEDRMIKEDDIEELHHIFDTTRPKHVGQVSSFNERFLRFDPLTVCPEQCLYSAVLLMLQFQDNSLWRATTT
jgi:hypothetical protein